MDVKSESIAINENATLDDLFEMYISRAFNDAPKEITLQMENSFYMGVNASLTLLAMAETNNELLEKLIELQNAFEIYNANLVGRQ